MPIRIHWVRHGRIAAHHGDVPLTADGRAQAEATGRQLGEQVGPGEEVAFLYAPTRRAHETAIALRSGIAESLSSPPEAARNGAVIRPAELRSTSAALSDPPARLSPDRLATISLLPPVECWALRNPDIYVAGARVELVSSATAMMEQLPDSGLSAAELMRIPFLRGFWGAADRIGYWVDHPNPPGEDARAVARRLMAFAVSLCDLPRMRPRRYGCVTHSGPMRAFLRHYLLGEDPGEPDYGEPIDLLIPDERLLIIRYREWQQAVALADRAPPVPFP
jgi:broad specificity phosphatase PhoE